MANPANTLTWQAHLDESRTQLSLGDLRAAERHLYQALRINPRAAQLYNHLGSLYYRQDRIAEAMQNFRKALRLDLGCWEALYNLANCFAKQNNWEQAALHYAEVIAMQPQHAHAHFNLGLSYVAMEAFVQAEHPLAMARELDPSLVEATRQLGHVSIALAKTEQALELFAQVLTQSDTRHAAEAHHNLAILHLRMDDRARALEHFEATLACDPNNQTAQYLSAALRGDPAPSQAPLVYIEQLFDQYAPYYNVHLKQHLACTLPAQLRNALGSCLKGSLRVGRVLDLGCGTGLCGIVFRDLALELVGVDLSAKMIAEATRLGTYEKLVQTDYQSFLADPTLRPFDTIVAGDVFVYQGDLGDGFAWLSKAVVPGGHFVFSVETSDTKDYQLNPSGRFSHAPAYIRKLSDTHSFQIIGEEEAVLRTHQQQAVIGCIFVLKRLA